MTIVISHRFYGWMLNILKTQKNGDYKTVFQTFTQTPVAFKQILHKKKKKMESEGPLTQGPQGQ